MTPTDKIKNAEKLLGEAMQELGASIQGEQSRRRGNLTHELWKVQKMLGRVQQYFSQSGQDRFIDNLLGNKRDGVFADIGGYDGVTGSNTLFFETFRGWSGILVEPTPDNLERSKEVRRCPCLGYGAGAVAGEMDFLHIESGYTQMSGFLDSYDQNLLGKVRENPNHREAILKVQSKTLPDILADSGLSQIDYLSLDVEGGELAILNDFPFADFDITALSIENNSHTSEIPKLMQSHGYKLVEFCGVDEIYHKGN